MELDLKIALGDGEAACALQSPHARIVERWHVHGDRCREASRRADERGGGAQSLEIPQAQLTGDLRWARLGAHIVSLERGFSTLCQREQAATQRVVNEGRYPRPLLDGCIYPGAGQVPLASPPELLDVISRWGRDEAVSDTRLG